MKKRLKINGVIMSVAFIGLVFFPRVFFRGNSSNPLVDLAEVSGFAFILLGQIIRVSARGYKSEHSRNSHALIQGGSYQIVRNPMYLGILLIGLGVVLVLFNLWAALVFLTIFIIRYLSLIYKEEKKLLAVFPQDYANYCKKVPRILPSFFSIIKLDISEYLPIRFIWFKREIGSILALLFFTLLLESWEDIRRAGIKAYLNESIWLLLTVFLF